MKPEKQRVILAGGSGFLGSCLAPKLIERGFHQAIVLTRSPSRYSGPGEAVEWDGRTAGDWAQLLDGAAAVINLTGKSVDCRYTQANKAEILRSRTDSVAAIAEAMRLVNSPPAVWIQAGSLAIHGHSGDELLDEDSKPGQGFSVDVCQRWEKAFFEADCPGCRKVLFRISFALGRGYGALEKLVLLTRFGLGGRAGTGEQWMSWIHIDDLCQMFLWALEHPEMEGVYSATSPDPRTNANFMSTLRKLLHRPWSPPIPEFAIHFGSFFLRTEPELILKGRRAVPKRLQEMGFDFEYPVLENALQSLLTNEGAQGNLQCAQQRNAR